ncbi:MAG: IS110 family transposase [bacterium]|nr:IS110 family transposase [bacterium]
MSAPTVRRDAAGVDISPTVMYVAVGPEQDPEPVRSFGSFTCDLYRIAEWLKSCGVRTVAMESTGVYWIPLYQVLEEQGMEVCLVNARHFKNVPGRKTDVQDCQWLQYLHSVGLLRASFRPPAEVCALRTLWRHRRGIVEAASEHIQHMQKALDQMNVQLHHVLSDVTGVTGLAMIDAILAGERDPRKLAGLRDKRVRASEEKIVKALEGDYREEHLFTLKQSLEAYRYCQRQIGECDAEIERRVGVFEGKVDPESKPPPPERKTSRPTKQGEFDMRRHHYRVFGVDLTQIPSIRTATVQVLLTEVGPNFQKFPDGGQFASWMTLCPHNDVTGGRVMKTGTKKSANRTAQALRMAAESLCRDQSYLGVYYRRKRAHIGAPKALTAAAHKLARVIYALVTTGREYDESVFLQAEKRERERAFKRLQRQARQAGYQLVKNSGASEVVS